MSLSSQGSSAVHRPVKVRIQTHRGGRSGLANQRAASTRPKSRPTGRTPFQIRQQAKVSVVNNSRFKEVQELKRQLKVVKKDNAYLRKQFKQIDEFRLAMDQKADLRNFSEKRVNMLKSHISRQRRHITNLNETLRLTRLFHKDLLNVLQFLIELSESD